MKRFSNLFGSAISGQDQQELQQELTKFAKEHQEAATKQEAKETQILREQQQIKSVEEQIEEEIKLWIRSLGWSYPQTPVSSSTAGVSDNIFESALQQQSHSQQQNLLTAKPSATPSIETNYTENENEVQVSYIKKDEKTRKLFFSIVKKATPESKQSFVIIYPANYGSSDASQKKFLVQLEGKNSPKAIPFLMTVNRFITKNNNKDLTITSILSSAVEFYENNIGEVTKTSAGKKKAKAVSNNKQLAAPPSLPIPAAVSPQPEEHKDEIFEQYSTKAKELANDDLPLSEEAKKFVIRQLAAILKQQNKAEGHISNYTVRPLGENPFVWEVKIRIDPQTRLGQDLIEFNKKYNFNASDLVVTMEFKFNKEFVLGSTLPVIRVIRPRMEYLSGNVQFNGLLCLNPTEYYSGASKSKSGSKKAESSLSMDALIESVRNSLVEHGARVDVRTAMSYDPKLAERKLEQMRRLNTRELQTKNNFKKSFFVFSGAFAGKIFPSVKTQSYSGFEYGNKILLPLSAADHIFQSPSFELPLIFEIKTSKQRYYCGSLEFTAPEGNAVIPEWMMKQLFLKEGEKAEIRCVSLPRGSFCTFQPHSKEFYKLKNHKAVFENALRNFSTLTEGTTIPIKYGSQVHYVEIAELRPSSAVSIIAEPYLDLKLDFLPAIDYDEEEEKEELIKEAKARAAAATASSSSSSAAPTTTAPAATAASEPISGDNVQCENCKRSVPKARYVMHLVQCQRHCFFCEKCKQVIRNADKQQHQQHVKCTACGKTDLLACEIESHNSTECTARMVQCQYCQVPVLFTQLEEHEAKCGTTTNICNECGQRYMVQDYFYHVSVCPGPEGRVLPGGGRTTGYRSRSSSYEGSSSAEYTCPYPSCAFPGLNAKLLKQHVQSVHSGDTTKVVCPICASRPGGDPNRTSQDFQGHMDSRH